MRRSSAVALVTLLSLLAAGGAVYLVRGWGPGTRAEASATTTTAPVVSSPYCRPNPRGGVHDPDRLQIMSPCAELDGTVVRPPKLNLSDGDVTFNVKPDAAYMWMMNAKNSSEGGLHVEVIPADQPGCTAAKLGKLTATNLGACTGANVLFPPLNAHVRVIGPFVYDRWVGWNEIHPAWQVDIIGATAPAPPETHTYSASLRGTAVPRHRGAPRGSGFVSLTLVERKLCWRFSRIRRVGKPSRAVVTRSARPGLDRLSV